MFITYKKSMYVSGYGSWSFTILRASQRLATKGGEYEILNSADSMLIHLKNVSNRLTLKGSIPWKALGQDLFLVGYNWSGNHRDGIRTSYQVYL